MKKLCERYDSYFETKTGEWLESVCDDSTCDYCKERPKVHKPHKTVFNGKEGVCK